MNIYTKSSYFIINVILFVGMEGTANDAFLRKHMLEVTEALRVAVLKADMLTKELSIVALKQDKGFSDMNEGIDDIKEGVADVKGLVEAMASKIDAIHASQCDVALIIRQTAHDVNVHHLDLKDDLASLGTKLSRQFGLLQKIMDVEGGKDGLPESDESMKLIIQDAVKTAIAEVNKGGLDDSIKEAIRVSIKECNSSETDNRDQLVQMTSLLLDLKDDVNKLSGEIAEVKVQLDAVNTALGSQNVLLRALVNNEHNVPTLLLMSPPFDKNSKKSLLLGKVKGMFQNMLQFNFVCPVTKKPVKSGPEGKGYKLAASKKWVKQAAPVLIITLNVVKIVAQVYGVPLPSVPPGLFGDGCFDMVIDQLTETVAEEVGSHWENGIELEDDEEEREAYFAAKEALLWEGNGDAAAQKALENAPKTTNIAYKAIRQLLIDIEKPKCNGGTGWSPKFTGLDKVIAKDGTTAWVSEEGKALFIEKGKDALV
jgi:archaellum component FlaC